MHVRIGINVSTSKSACTSDSGTRRFLPGKRHRKGVFPAIYDSSETLLVSECDNNAGGLVQTSVAFVAGNSDMFYVQVAAHADSISGSYKLRILPRYDEPAAAWDSESFEPNNQPENAHLITIGRLNALQATIENRNAAYSTEKADADWYRFEAVAGETYVVEVYNVAASLSLEEGTPCTNSVFSPRSGLWLQLLDPSRNEVNKECDNNGSGNVQTSIEITAGNSGPYHIGVVPHSDNVSGDYSVRVRYLPCLSPTLQTSKAECEALTALYESTVEWGNSQ